MRRTIVRLAVTGAAAGMLLSGCTAAAEEDSPGTAAPASAGPAAAPSVPAGAPDASGEDADEDGEDGGSDEEDGAGETTETGSKASANTASETEIAEALEAGGVSDAARWAHEVVKHRPYDAADPALAKLEQELAKENPGDGILDKIIEALRP